MIKDEKTKLGFLELAYFLSITDVKNGDDEDYVEEEKRLSPFTVRGSDSFYKTKDILARKKVEAHTLEMYAGEMNAFDASGDQDTLRARLNKFVEEALKRFLELSETTNEKILNNQDIRLSFVKDSVDAVCEENDLLEKSTEIKKVIVFELVGMAYADDEISESELNVLNYICEKLEIDYEFVDDAKEIVEKMVNLHRRGLEIINE